MTSGEMPKRRAAPCYRCGTVARTRDHVFPRSLYTRLPDPGLTVPACGACQALTQPDEDYLREFAASIFVRRHETARDLWPAIRRSFRHDPKRGRAFLDAVRRLDVHSDGGIFLGSVDVPEGDLGRINRALEKIVRGLWNLETRGDVMPADDLKWHFEFVAPNQPELPQVVVDAIRGLPSRNAGPEVEYRFAAFPEDPRLTLAWMAFYGPTMFLVSTSPADDASCRPRPTP